jgi:hypothetical protein
VHIVSQLVTTSLLTLVGRRIHFFMSSHSIMSNICDREIEHTHKRLEPTYLQGSTYPSLAVLLEEFFIKASQCAAVTSTLFFMLTRSPAVSNKEEDNITETKATTCICIK